MKIALIIIGILICAKMWSCFDVVKEHHRYFHDTYNSFLRWIILGIVTAVVTIVDTIALDINWLWSLVGVILIIPFLSILFTVIKKGKTDGLVPIQVSETPIWIRSALVMVLAIITFFIR